MTNVPPNPDDPAAHPTTLFILRSLGHICLGLLFLVCFIWILGAENKFDAAYKLFKTIIVHLFSGAAGNAVIGVRYAMSLWFLFVQSLLTDLVIVLYAYTLFVSSFQHASKWRFIGPKLIAAHDFALEYKDRIKPYGIVGLCAFVVFPIWSTGPLVASIIGYMIGLGTITTFSSITLATAAATAFYIFAYDWVLEKNSTAAMLIMIIVIVLACAAIFTKRKVKNTLEEKREVKEDDCQSENVIDVRAEETKTSDQ